MCGLFFRIAETPWGESTVISGHTVHPPMVVKSVRGRRRYVAFTTPEGMHRDEMVSTFETLAIPSVKVITCGHGKAVIRCDPGHVPVLIDAYEKSFPGNCSLRTSGTLRTLRDADPELKAPRRRRK